MVNFREKYVKKTLNLANKLRGFFYGEVYLAIVSIITVLSYCLNLSVIGLCCLCVFAVITLLLYQDFTPFAILPMVVLLIVRDLNMFLSFYTYIPLFFVLIALVIHFVVFPIKLKKAKLYMPLIVLSVTLLTSGLFAENIFSYYHLGLVSRLATGPLILFVYYLFVNCFNPPNNFDFEIYFSRILVYFGLICFVQMSAYDLWKELGFVENASAHIGWNNVNGVASLIILCIPACFYLMVKEGSVFTQAFALVLIYRGLYLTESDGCIGISLTILPVLFFFAYLKADKKIRLKLLALAGVILLGVFTLLTISIIQTGNIPILEKIRANIFRDSGRTPIYENAIENFLKYPIFGVGIGYHPQDIIMDTTVVIAFNYHSTFFHVIATMGSVGLIAFAWYFIRRYQILMTNDSPFNTFMLASFTFTEVYGFIDTVEFNIVPLMLIIIIMLSAVEVNNKKPKQLPLIKDRG